MARGESPIFVVGMPRSGTTLLSAMLSSHERIAIAPETLFLTEWMRRYRQLDVRERAAFQIFWRHFGESGHFRNLGIDRETARIRILSLEGGHDYRGIFATLLAMYAERKGKVRWGEKTATNYAYVDLLLRWFPEARIIWMVRDPRAVVASRLRVPWVPRMVDDIASQWQMCVDNLDRWAHDPRIQAVQYERLVCGPETELRKLCDSLQERYSPAMLDHIAAARDLVLGPAWDEALKPVRAANIHKWRHGLSDRQIAIIEHFTRSGMERYGYQGCAESLPQSWVFWLKLIHTARRLKRGLFAAMGLLA